LPRKGRRKTFHVGKEKKKKSSLSGDKIKEV
jgi:hypothetical protein